MSVRIPRPVKDKAEFELHVANLPALYVCDDLKLASEAAAGLVKELLESSFDDTEDMEYYLNLHNGMGWGGGHQSVAHAVVYQIKKKGDRYKLIVRYGKRATMLVTRDIEQLEAALFGLLVWSSLKIREAGFQGKDVAWPENGK